MFKRTLNQKGISLMEVMVAAGISSVIALGTMKINENSQKAMRSVATKSELNNYLNYRLGNSLEDNVICSRAFDMDNDGAGRDGVDLALGEEKEVFQLFLDLDDGNPTTLAQKTVAIPGTSGEFILNNMQIRRDSDTSCTLTLNLDRSDSGDGANKLGGRNKRETIGLGCTFNGTILQTCSTKGGGGGRWDFESLGTETWLQNSYETAYLGIYSGTSFPPARLTVEENPSAASNWGAGGVLFDGFALSANHVIRWGDVETPNAGTGVYSDGGDCVNATTSAGSDFFSTCSAGATTISSAGGTSVANGLSVTSGNFMVPAGSATIQNGLTVSSGGATVTAGGLTVSAGGAAVTGNVSSTADVSGVNGVFSGNISGVNGTFTGVLSGNSLTVATTGNFTGDVTANGYYYSSDKRLKEKINPLNDSLKAMLGLNPVSYNWKDSEKRGSQKEMGFIAQEIEKTYPGLVKDGANGYKSVNYAGLIAPIIKSLKEMYAMITETEKSVEELKTEHEREIASLKAENFKLKKENEDIKERLEKIEKAVFKDK